MASQIQTEKNIYVLGDKQVVGAKNLQIFTISFIEQNLLLNDYDGIIFTSKNAVLGINKCNDSWKNIPAYAIAQRTGDVVNEIGGNLKFVGTKKHGDDFAHELVELFQNSAKNYESKKIKKLLYIRGKEVVSNLVSILKTNSKDTIECHELVVYETICKDYENIEPLPKGSIIIFSAPSTIKCFLNNNLWDDSFKAIAIGKTTAKYFPPYIKPILSDDVSLEACVAKALEVLA